MNDITEKKLRVKLDEIINSKSNWVVPSYTMGRENPKVINDKKVINEIIEYLKGGSCLNHQ